MTKDLYTILGVSNVATQDDIKKAYRKKAKELHPDVNSDPNAEIMFKDISEAYTVLGDPQKRRMYDFGHGNTRNQSGSNFDPFDVVFGRYDGARNQPDDITLSKIVAIKTAVNITLQEAYQGVTKRVNFNKSVFCEPCMGTGAETGEFRECSNCGGAGVINRSFNGGFNLRVSSTCNVCGGEGRVPVKKCQTCGGKGAFVKSELIDIQIPKGIHTGSDLAIDGVGNEYRKGMFGRLICRVQILPCDKFERRSNDLFYKYEIPLKAALLGGELEIDLISGEKEKIKLQPPVRQSTTIVLNGKGMPILSRKTYGDMIITFSIQMPHLTEDQKKILENIL